MSIFKLKLKTRNGNDVKKKQVFNIMFSVKYFHNILTRESNGLYTFSILYGDGKSYKSDKIYKLKDPVKTSNEFFSKKEVMFRIIFNLLNIAAKISKQENINPDIIILNSIEFNSETNKECVKTLLNLFSKDYSINTKNRRGNKKNFKKNPNDPGNFAISSIEEFCYLNNKVRFIIIDPVKNSEKYKKSLYVCKELKNIITQSLENEE